MFYNKNSFDIGNKAVLIDQIEHHLSIHKKRAILVEISDVEYGKKWNGGTPEEYWKDTKTFYIGDRGKMIFFGKRLGYVDGKDWSKMRYVLAQPVKIVEEDGCLTLIEKGQIALATYDNVTTLLKVID